VALSVSSQHLTHS